MALPLTSKGPPSPPSVEDVELDLLLAGIVRRWGFDFRGYARASLRRRVGRALEREGVRTISELQSRVLRSDEAMQRFIATISVHVSAMFRDPAFYLALRQKVVPILRTHPFVRVWVAGCATGEEVYSMAILLHEAGLGGRARIYATDLSDSLLDRAGRGVFPLRAMRDYTRNYIASGGAVDFSSYYTTDQQHAIMRRELRENVVFSQHNLVSDGSFNEFHLVLCRNVLIYFDEALRDRVHGLMTESLVRHGVLGLGTKETLRYSRVASRFDVLDEGLSLYRRKA
ncbi:MAG: protein-glutamate O-methyltransferase CheR [Myxococcota bacterium]|nr:protein-glutamate O-methyltransferase CheR [Myxococcota bacterium]